MTYRRMALLGILVLGLVVAAGVGWWVYARSQSMQFKIAMRGSQGNSGNLGVSGGNLVVVAPKPGVFFGTVRHPGTGGGEHFTYLILFKYGIPKTQGRSPSLEFGCTTDGRKAETKDAIALDGKRIEAVYHIELDEKANAVAQERLTLGGKGVDMTAGHVFLIDLTADAPSYLQKNLELPAISGKLETPEDVERLAETIRSSLESQDAEIKAFLR